MGATEPQLRKTLSPVSEAGSSEYRLLLYAPAVGLAVVFLALYVHYSFQAWFWWDDFFLLAKYKDHLLPEELFTLSNFGRFISRNLYWHVVYNAAGADSRVFFLVNLSLIAITSLLCYRFVRQLTGELFTAAFSALIYLIMLPTQIDFSWISNSQHILGHTIVLLFLVTACNPRKQDPPGILRSIALILLFIAGLYTNLLVLGLIPAYFCYPFIFRDQHLPDTAGLVAVTLMVLFSLVFWLKLRGNLSHFYDVEFSVTRLAANCLAYTVGTHFSVIAAGRAALMIVLALCFAWLLIKKDPAGVYLFVLAGSFFLPTAFLVEQRQPHYMALTVLFTSAALLRAAYRSPYAPLLAYLLIAGHLWTGLHAQVTYRLYRGPFTGEKVRRLVEELGTSVGSHGRVCLQSADKSMDRPYGYDSASPSTWLYMGEGAVFRLFSQFDVRYLTSSSPPCKDRPTVVIAPDLSITSIIPPSSPHNK